MKWLNIYDCKEKGRAFYFMSVYAQFSYIYKKAK